MYIRVSFVVALSYIILYFRIQMHNTVAIENCVYNVRLFFHRSVEQMAVPSMKLQGNPTSEQTLRSEIWIAFPVQYHSASEVMLCYLT